ncbi:MAG: DNA topoisomerase IV subunit B [Myxococcota bacterium]
MARDTKYDANAIEVLEGLEPVRKRPAMYIGGTDVRGFHHLLWEIVDNSVDEAINGHARKIQVAIDEDRRGCTVTDDGRGIPVDRHPKFKKPAVEVILTTLHAGGKFGGKNYQVSGGLHGVGSSVVNALSEAMEVRVWRDGREHVQHYARGRPTGPLKKGAATRKHGTRIHFRPDPKIFGARAAFDVALVTERLEARSYLHAGLQLTLRDEKSGEVHVFEHPNGIADYLPVLVHNRERPGIHESAFVLHKEGETRVDLALMWTEGLDYYLRSYVNGIRTQGGGTHEGGLNSAIVKSVRAFIEAKKLPVKGVTLTAEDIREGGVGLLSVYVVEPQFQGQTKDRLNNPEVHAAVEGVVRPALEQWLLENPSSGEAIVARSVQAARARAARKAATAEVARKSATNTRLHLPGKLADCSSSDPGECELFIVEGDSAGGSAKMGRDRRTQAILPLRGKVLNTEQASLAKVLGNKELQDVVNALGCGVGKGYDPSKLRYHRVFLLMDADSDGHHIATLLLTFFYRHLTPLVRSGHVYLAQPPLFRVDAAKETYFALDEAERDRILVGLPGNVKPKISRFKGLGEMNPKELKETTLDPKRRRALRVTIDGEVETDRVIHQLMGRDPGARYAFIMDRAAGADTAALDV